MRLPCFFFLAFLAVEATSSLGAETPSCLELSAAIRPASTGTSSVEVTARNRCGVRMPAQKTGYKLELLDSAGATVRVFSGKLSRDLEAGETASQTLATRVLAGGSVVISRLGDPDPVSPTGMMTAGATQMDAAGRAVTLTPTASYVVIGRTDTSRTPTYVELSQGSAGLDLEGSKVAAPTSSMSSWANKVKLTPVAERKGGIAMTQDPRVSLRLLRFFEYKNDFVDVEVAVTNLRPQQLWVRVLAQGELRGAAETLAFLEPYDDRPLMPLETMTFSGMVRTDNPSSLKVGVMSVRESGLFETAEERKMRECLAFSAEVVSLPGKAAKSIEVHARNSCARSVPADLTEFEVDVRDFAGQFIRKKTGRFREDLPARATARQQVSITVPVGGKVSVSRFSMSSTR
ncbi:MAG: hypothetical protein IT186_07140 [Acidobacteria bacterium]|nr:hypothetical protein [Acidobacteriota bacterium]